MLDFSQVMQLARIAPTKGIEPVSPQKLRSAAKNLGDVYQSMENEWHPDLPFGPWAIPEQVTLGRPALLIAIRKVYSQSPESDRKILYTRDYELVMPAVKKQTLKFTEEVLTAEKIQLGNLLKKLKWEHGLLERLQKAAIEVARKAGGFDVTDRDLLTVKVRRAMAKGFVPPGSDEVIKDYASARSNKGMQAYDKDFWASNPTSPLPVSDRELNPIIRKRIAKALHEFNDEYEATRQRIAEADREINDEVHSTLSTLFLHPQGIAILDTYSKNPITGNQYAMGLVNDAIRSVTDFHYEIKGKEDHIGRYPFLVMGGVSELGLHNIPGFKEYAVNVGQVLGQNIYEKLIGFAGITILFLGLFFTEPLGLLVLSGADLALAGAGAALTYMREREQELGAEASGVRGETEQFATSTGYLDTKLAGAAALLSGIAFFKATKEFKELVKVKPKNIAEVLAPKRDAVIARPKADLASADSTATLGRKVEGSRGLEAPPLESKTVNNAVPDRTTEIARPPENRSVTATSIEDDQARAIHQDVRAPDEPSGKAALQEEIPEIPYTPKESERLRSRGVRSLSPADDVETISNRALLKELQRSLERQIEEKDAVISKLKAAKGRNYRKLESVNNRLKAAKASGQADEVARLEARRAVLAEVQESIPVKEFNLEKLELQKLLRCTEGEYFEKLTNAASKRLEYVEVRQGKVDKELFKPILDEPWVEHIYPRKKIFETPGFVSLEWEQQIFLFNYRKNLEVVSAEFNRLRGIQPYRHLNPKFWSMFIKDEEALAKLVAREDEMQGVIEKLINNPKDADMWKKFGYVDK